MEGIITKQISNDYTVTTANAKYICKARGKFRNMHITPLVGDNVIIDEKKKIITELLTRKNELQRPPVANIDRAIIITSLKKPDFSSNLLDKLLTVIEYNRIIPIIIFTKADLLTAEEQTNLKPYIDYYKKIGYEVYMNNELDQIKKIFKDKLCVFTGQSGAGKSTLLNKIDENLKLKTNEISDALNRGKHTTRHTELLSLCGGLVADTPGFSALEFTGMSNGDIRDNFTEFNIYRDQCEYRDCMHDKETQCAIKEKVKDGTILKSRYENYLNFIKR